MNIDSLNNPVGRLRVVGLIEGLSFLILLGIAMPLKRLADMPEAVTIVGWIHGVLWMLYLLALALAWRAANWGPGPTLLAFIASIVPFGPFLLDPRLKREEQAMQLTAAESA